MNIWQFNLANQSFLSDCEFYIGECCCILHALGNKMEKLVVLNLAHFVNRQTAKINSMTNFHLIQ